LSAEPPVDERAYREILAAIVKRFVRLVGAPAALRVARRVPHFQVDGEGNVLSYDPADPLDTINRLIDQYGAVFGEAGVALSRRAAQTPGEGILTETSPFAPVLNQPVRFLLVDDHLLFRDGIAALVNAQPSMTVVGATGSAQEAVKLARELRPDIVLMDVSLPDGTGVHATQAILAELPSTRIVFLTVHEEDEQLFAALRAGGMGYMFKNVRAADLVKTLQGVIRGEAGISRVVARRILDEFSRTPAPRPATSEATLKLTAREVEVVRELARGATNREIAAKFVISENTVKNHVRNVLSKLHLHNRREVAHYARDHNLLPPPPNSPH
jgi:DNA-binding NarL/FixJ family response regulator